MSEFPECLLIVTAEVGATVEAEWNRSYDTVHLPDALRCPGVRRGRRYVSSGEITESAAGKTELVTRQRKEAVRGRLGAAQLHADPLTRLEHGRHDRAL